MCQAQHSTSFPIHFYYNLILLSTIHLSLPLPLKSLCRIPPLVTYSIPPKHFSLNKFPVSCSSYDLWILRHFKRDYSFFFFFLVLKGTTNTEYNTLKSVLPYFFLLSYFATSAAPTPLQPLPAATAWYLIYTGVRKI